MMQPPTAPSPRRIRRTLAVCAAFTTIWAPTASASTMADPGSVAARIRDLQSQREALRSRKASAAAQVDTLKASTAQLQAALAALNNEVDGQSSLLEESKRAEAAAEADLAAARAQEAKAIADLGTLRTDIRAQAVKAFVTAPKDATLELMTAGSLADAASRNTIMEVRATKQLDAAEQYRSVQQDLAIARERSTSSAKRAADHKASVQQRLKSLQDSENKQQKFSDAVEARLEAQLAEAAGLASTDAALAGELTSRQSELAAQLAAERAAANRRAAANGTPSAVRASSGGSGPSAPITDGSSIVSVNGIRVHSSIASALGAMLAAAAADGVVMSGGGYRDPAAQIAVRRSNCGSSDYAIYQEPASSCSPPTARPGQSMHERGLAIDFTQGGGTIGRSSSAFAWLSAHAAQYGFHNLPSESWHWSTSGD